MGSTIFRDDLPQSKLEKEDKKTSENKSGKEEPWKTSIMTKLQHVERYYQKHGSSISPSGSASREDYLREANKLGDVTEIANLIQGGVNGKKLTWKLVLTALPLKGILKPLFNVMAKGQSYGVVHAGVQIGRHTFLSLTSLSVGMKFRMSMMPYLLISLW